MVLTGSRLNGSQSSILYVQNILGYIQTHLLPYANNIINLGSASLNFATAYIIAIVCTTITATTGIFTNITTSGTFTMSALTASRLVITNASKQISNLAMTDGQIAIGSTSGSIAAASITGTANQVVVSGGSNTITLSTPQDIGTGSSPSFNRLTLAGTSSQLTTGSTHTAIFSITQPALNRVYTIDDMGADCSVVMTAATQTIGGNKTLSGNNTYSGTGAHTNTTDSTTSSTGSHIFSGGVAINKSLVLGTLSSLLGLTFLNNISSYAASVLNYWEDGGTFSITASQGITLTTNISFLRYGKLVVLMLPDLATATGSTANTIIFPTSSIPARLIPTGISPSFPLSVYDNNVILTTTGTLTVLKIGSSLDGEIIISKDAKTNTAFTGTNKQGSLATSLHYFTA
jgi:hypothetical protein